jgi:hypothetical protein
MNYFIQLILELSLKFDFKMTRTILNMLFCNDKKWPIGFRDFSLKVIMVNENSSYIKFFLVHFTGSQTDLSRLSAVKKQHIVESNARYTVCDIAKKVGTKIIFSSCYILKNSIG